MELKLLLTLTLGGSTVWRVPSTQYGVSTIVKAPQGEVNTPPAVPVSMTQMPRHFDEDDLPVPVVARDR